MDYKDRRNRILKIISGLGFIDIKKLKNEFNVSEMTIYRDLKFLGEKGHLRKTTGWITRENDLFVNQINPFIQRVQANINIKKAIAKKALEHINNDNSIFIDGGTTNFMLIKEINYSNLKNLTIISDNIVSQMELSENEDIEVIATGGNVIKNDYSCYGMVPEKILEEINADIAFITTRGISVNGKLSTPNINEGKIKQLFIKKAIKKILITDSTKFGVIGLYNFADISDFDVVITDKNIPQDFLKMYNNLNLKIEIVENI